MFKLTRAMMLFTLPVVLVALFAGGAVLGSGWPAWAIGALLWFAVLVVIIVLHNTTPRLRTDQAVSFFWGPVTVLAAIAAALAALGW